MDFMSLIYSCTHRSTGLAGELLNASANRQRASMPKTPQMDEKTLRERLVVGIYGLLVACPYEQGNPASCQLFEIRKKKLRDRVEWVQSLSFDDMVHIMTVHKGCLAYREGDHQKPTDPLTTPMHPA
jgi:hypothetical protein